MGLRRARRGEGEEGLRDVGHEWEVEIVAVAVLGASPGQFPTGVASAKTLK
jgi:hypothetical protein